jgi:hypothetical protein
MNDIWHEAHAGLRTALLDQWDKNGIATNGSITNLGQPYWADKLDPKVSSRSPFKWDEERRAQLQADLDGLYAHLYGLTHDEFAYILDKFPIVRRKDEASFGEYRTKRLCLEAYDRLEDSDLIPAEARALQQQPAWREGAALPAAKPVSPPAALPTPPPAPATPPPPPPKPAPAVAPPTPKAAPQSQMPLMDYTLYKCQGCGKMVLGFDQAGHTSKAHQGVNPGYKKVGH